MLAPGILQRLKEHLRSQGVVLAYLFGSLERGEEGPMSDVDVAVLLDREPSREEAWDAMLRLPEEVSRILGRKADVVVLELAPVTLRFAVIDEGSILLNDDEDRRVDFEWETIREYLDTQHLREIQRYYLYEWVRGGSHVAAS